MFRQECCETFDNFTFNTADPYIVKKLINEITTADPSQSALKKTRLGGGQRYTVDWRKLRDVLQKTKRYDPNAAV